MCITHSFGGVGGVRRGHNSLNNSSHKPTEQGVSDWIAIPLPPELLGRRGGQQTARCVSVQAAGHWPFIIHESLIRN